MTIVTWVFLDDQWYIRWDYHTYTDCGQAHQYGLRKAITDKPTICALETAYTTQPECVRREAIS